MKPMRIRIVLPCIGMLFLLVMKTQAQDLASGPDRINVSSKQLDQVFNRLRSPQVSVRFSPNFAINGVVSEQIKVDEVLETVNIRCQNFDNALLTIHRITEPKQATKYTGRIIHPQSKDLYVLVADEAGYVFQKQPTQSFILQ
jgi:hypothetical protein